MELAVTALEADFRSSHRKLAGSSRRSPSFRGRFHFAGGSSVLLDHVFIALSEEAAHLLSTKAAAVAWVHDAFRHLKVIGAADGAKALLDRAGVVADEGVLIGSDLETYLGTSAKGKLFAHEPNVSTVFRF